MKLAYRSTNWIVLAGGIVEVRCDPGGATRRRREPSPLHQGARRRVEVVVARGTGDRERGHRAGRADAEGDADHALSSASAGCVRIEETTADFGAHLRDIAR